MKRSQIQLIQLYAGLFSLALFLQFSYTQVDFSLMVNRHWSAFADRFFSYITYLGDGYMVCAIGLVTLLVNRRLGITILLAYAVSALITQGLKHWVFDGMYRPTWIIRDVPLHKVDGVEVYAFNSFPSGHSTSVMSLATVLACYKTNRWLRLMLLLLAALVCFSRIYLLQHFLQDTIAGAFIGASIAFVLYQLIWRKIPENQ